MEKNPSFKLLNMKRYLVYLLTGLLSWVVPFVIGIGFHNKEGQLLVNQDLFKSVMVVTGTLTGMLLLSYLYNKGKIRSVADALWVGIIWLGVNWIFDIFILLPVAKLSFDNYYQQIGLRYLSILIICWFTGRIAFKRGRSV